MCSSFQIPRSCGLMRRFGEYGCRFAEDNSCAADGATAEMNEVPVRWRNRPALEYWHIGETMIRLRSRTSRICKLSNSTGQPPGADALVFVAKQE